MAETRSTTYASAGVDTEQEQVGLDRLTDRLHKTWPAAGAFGEVLLPFGQFANVINFGGIGLAMTTDGVGSKVLIAEMLGKYDTLGIDCVAVNVNDLLCVGATPVSMVDYIAVQEPRVDLIDELSKGLLKGAKMSHISITGGEYAQLPDLIKGDRDGYGFDLAGTAVGSVPLDKLIYGQGLQAGDVIIGIPSSGIHSNGLTLARKVFLKDHHYGLDWLVPGSDKTLGEELLEPTFIYVAEVVELFNKGVELHGLAHITSDGFLNLPRLDAKVGYDIDSLPEIPPIFSAIQQVGGIEDEEMYTAYNMGIGFCVIAPEHAAGQVLDILKRHGRDAQPIGRVTADPERKVFIRPAKLVGQGKHFHRI